jgi:hypothetical protein
MFEELKGKNVKVVMRDGFLKFGVLIDYEDNFITLQYKDFTTEHINLSDVKIVKSDVMNDGNRNR